MITTKMPLPKQRVVRYAKEDALSTAWSDYERFLSQRSEPFARVARSVITRRRIKERFTAGLHFPSWFGEAFKEQSEEYLRRLTLGNLYLYLYVVIVDDQIDDHLNQSQDAAIVADLHRAESLRVLEELCGDKDFFRNEFQRMEKAWLEHDRDLVGQYKTLGHGVPPVESYAKKCAILKASGLALASRERVSGTWIKLSRAYDLTAMANTFADDLTDWKEDVRSNHRTYLVSMALRENGSQLHRELSSCPEEEIALRIYRSSAVGDSLGHALRFIEEAKSLFASCGAHSWLGFVTELESNITDVIERWQEVRHSPAEHILEFDASLRTKFCGT
jgi:hypothetical protein